MYTTIFLFLNMGTPEIMLIMFVVLLLFGGKKLPELARGLGKGIREFKDASEGVKREIHNSINNVTDQMDVEPAVKSSETITPNLTAAPINEEPLMVNEEPLIVKETSIIVKEEPLKDKIEH